MGPSGRNRILLVGWDGASWDVVNSLLEREALPDLRRLIEQGVMGDLSSVGPLAAPLVHTSVATGKFAEKHGILGTEEVRRDRTVKPVNSLSRRAKAFWEILSQNDLRCHVVNFPATGPAEPINGVFVSPAFFAEVRPSYETPFDLPADSVFPDERLPALKELILSLEEIDGQTAALFVPRLKEVDPGDRRLGLICAVLAQTLSVHAVVTWLIENTEWDVTSVNYLVIDALWRQFLKYLPPRLDGVAQRDFELYNQVAVSAVRLCDLLLGRLLELAGEDATVILYSPRRYAPHHQLPPPALLDRPVSRELFYRGEGIFVLRAVGGRKDQLIQGASSLDLCPTVLRLCGVAPGQDMDGRVLEDAFSQPLPPVETVESWETIPPCRPQPEDLAESLPWTEMTGFSVPFAHRPAGRARTENDWNLARTFLASGQPELALPMLTRLYYAGPLQVERASLVAEVFYLTGQAPEALAVMEPVAESFPDSPTGQFMAGLIALHRGYTYSALDFFEAVRRDNPPSPQLFFYLGQACLLLDRLPRAIEAYTRCLEINPNFVHGHLALSEALHRSGQFEAAADAASDAIKVGSSNPGAHVALGKALVKLDQADPARRSFLTALQLNPDHEAAHAYIEFLDEGGDEPEIELGLPTGGAAAMSAWSEEARQDWLDVRQKMIQGAREEVDEWRSRFAEDLAAADRRLDDYLAKNAAAREIEFSPQGAVDVAPAEGGGEGREVAWTIRPPLPTDQPVLCQLFQQPFANPDNQEMFVIHPAGSTAIRGGVALVLQDPKGRIVKMTLSLRGEGDAALPGQAEELLTTRLLRAGVARAAAGGAERVTFTLAGDEAPGPLRRCLERLTFTTALDQTIYAMEMAECRDRCLAMVEQERRQGAIPDDIRLVSLEHIPYARADQFLRQFFADGPGAPQHEFSLPLCRVMLKGREVIAAYVGQRKGEGTFAVTRLGVLDEFQLPWVTLWLLGDGARGGCEDGLTSLEFYADEVKYPEFVKIARHFNARQSGTLCTLALAFVVPWTPEAHPGT